MKKWMIAVIAVVLIALVVISGYLLIHFIILSSSYNSNSGTDDTEQDIVGYAQENWPQFQASYDSDSRTLTLSKETQMSFENACAFGASVYSNELAPETYLNDVATIARDIETHCGCDGLTVTLCYLSTEGTPIFSVSSDGSIDVCWQEE